MAQDRGNGIVVVDKHDLCLGPTPYSLYGLHDVARRIARIAPPSIIQVEDPPFTLVVIGECPYREVRRG